LDCTEQLLREEQPRDEDELMGEAPESLAIRTGQEVRITLQLPPCFSFVGGEGGITSDSIEESPSWSRDFFWGGEKETILFKTVQCDDKSARVHWCCARIDVEGEARANLQFLLNVVTVAVEQPVAAGFVNSTTSMIPCALYTARRVLVLSCPETGSSNHDDSHGPWDELVMDKVQELQLRSRDGNIKLAFDRKGSTTCVSRSSSQCLFGAACRNQVFHLLPFDKLCLAFLVAFVGYRRHVYTRQGQAHVLVLRLPNSRQRLRYDRVSEL
jgi:hypothetical protein